MAVMYLSPEQYVMASRLLGCDGSVCIHGDYVCLSQCTNCQCSIARPSEIGTPPICATYLPGLLSCRLVVFGLVRGCAWCSALGKILVSDAFCYLADGKEKEMSADLSVRFYLHMHVSGYVNDNEADNICLPVGMLVYMILRKKSWNTLSERKVEYWAVSFRR